MDKIEKTVDISRDNLYEYDGRYTDWYKCPECNGTDITEDSRYCPDCGVRLQWVARKDGDQ